MTRSTTRALQAAVAVFGAALLVAAGTAVASAQGYGDDDVDVNVQISDTGTLSMTVAGTAVQLNENTTHGDPNARIFKGTLPTVTVTDTRSEYSTPPGGGVAWYVLGTATDFIGAEGQPNIPAGRLGWEPELLTDDSDGLVSAGLDVAPGQGGTVFDQELLLGSADSLEVLPTGQWKVNAGLTLGTAATVDPGNYKSVLTLSLFEN